VFTGLDYAENMVLLVEMLKVLLLLWIFCNRKPTKLQTTTDSPASTVSVAGKTLEFVDSFTYLGSKMHCSGNSDTVTEVHKRFAIAHQCMNQLDRQILCSHIALAFQICLYILSTFVLFHYTTQKPGQWCRLYKNAWTHFTSTVSHC